MELFAFEPNTARDWYVAEALRLLTKQYTTLPIGKVERFARSHPLLIWR
jgi:hypothetical protein